MWRVYRPWLLRMDAQSFSSDSTIQGKTSQGLTLQGREQDVRHYLLEHCFEALELPGQGAGGDRRRAAQRQQNIRQPVAAKFGVHRDPLPICVTLWT